LEERVASFVINGDNNIEAFGILCNSQSKRANALFNLKKNEKKI